jgi:transcriptional regulator with XRE-family HTH domain
MTKSLEWVAENVGTSHSSVHRWELGTSGVDDRDFAAIARAYGISEAELSVHPRDAEKARQMHRVIVRLRQMDAEGVRTLADLAERLTPAK